MIFDPDMTSVNPYFIQALHQWISDNDLTPLIVVDANYQGVRVPSGIEDDGKITLNVSWGATDHLNMDDELMTFSARFAGRSQALIIPMGSIISIFARENGKGMVFEIETVELDEAVEPEVNKPVLKSAESKPAPKKKETVKKESILKEVSDKPNKGTKKKTSKKPHLTIVD